MIKSLQIKDYALIEKINVEFEKGLNIITGETGAGKSILIDAMSLLLGDRASTEVVRKGSEKSIVEGIFEAEGNKKLEEILKENDIDFWPEMIVRREISLKGTNRCFINDTPVPLNLIKELGFLLVDLHGQHEHQSLLRKETHIEMLDDFAELDEELSLFKKQISDLKNILTEVRELREKEKLLKEKKELYEFQIKEIDSVNPIEGEEEELVNELNILENSERLLELTTSIFSELYESDESIYDKLGEIKNQIEELSEIDSSFIEKLDELKNALTQINDVADFVRSYKDNIDLESGRLKEIRDRLGTFGLLKKKYGGSISAVIEHRKKIGDEFDLVEGFDERLKIYENELKQFRIKAGETAKKISIKRKKAAKEIKRGIEESLKYLGINESIFEVKFDEEFPSLTDENFILLDNNKIKFTPRGTDKVEFYLSTNLGEDVKPLQKVASGGEVSRVMLAMKMNLAKNDKLPLLIFDEIDTGVSGRIAQKVGQSLKELSRHHQIIAITHLPQIAGLADHHYFVQKIEKENRSSTSIKLLSEDEQIHEVAKLLGGENITEANLKSAKELMSVK
ncbi:MAG: DNA repair protein RecN [Ignavibacteriales bacterium]|jgi:DNA repair protein RecN (Recombination protein N)|nr:MAG: DNA repair protein RecN [Ignavibacteriales bacterium]